MFPARPPKPTKLALFFVLLGIYLLVYVPIPDSIDGKALLASAASLVRHGSPDMAVIAADDMALLPIARIGTLTTDGQLFSKKGLTSSLALAPFVAVADAMPGWSVRATAMLFAPLITALTAVVLVTLVQAMGYSGDVAFAVGLLFGLGTMALPYTKTLYGEPLAALLLLCAVLNAYR